MAGTVGTRVVWTFVVTTLAVAAVSACNRSEAQVQGTSIERTTDAPPPTTTSTVAPSSSPPSLMPSATEQRDPGGPVFDWEGQRYDFGTIRSVRVDGGRAVLAFDRMQIVEEDGSLHSGPTLSREPIIVANTDSPFVNQSHGLRTFSVAPDVVVKRLSAAWSCGPDGPPAPTWDSVPLEQLIADGIGDDSQDSLTFDDVGRVVQIRLSRGC